MSLNVARYDLVRDGRVLATRPKGRDAGRAAAERLAEADGLLLSFWGVDVASLPFLDEVIRQLRAMLFDGGKLLVVTGFNEDVKESIEILLAKHKMTLAALEQDQISLLGGSAHLNETLREAQELREFTAPELAERLSMKLPAVHARLNALAEAGAIARQDDPTAKRGKRGKYRVPTPADAGNLAPPPTAKKVEPVTA
ncbi:MAG: hypothetical protein JWQ18_1095 [Conexibacter sp.]|nr:hypothetical protein [Conexibacter sp.]